MIVSQEVMKSNRLILLFIGLGLSFFTPGAGSVALALPPPSIEDSPSIQDWHLSYFSPAALSALRELKAHGEVDVHILSRTSVSGVQLQEKFVVLLGAPYLLTFSGAELGQAVLPHFSLVGIEAGDEEQFWINFLTTKEPLVRKKLIKSSPLRWFYADKNTFDEAKELLLAKNDRVLLAKNHIPDLWENANISILSVYAVALAAEVFYFLFSDVLESFIQWPVGTAQTVSDLRWTSHLGGIIGLASQFSFLKTQHLNLNSKISQMALMTVDTLSARKDRRMILDVVSPSSIPDMITYLGIAGFEEVPLH